MIDEGRRADTPARRAGRRFTTFMASGGGRFARGVLGVGLIAAGWLLGPPAGYALAGFGLVPIAAGVLNLCPIAPLWGGHFIGSRYCEAPTKRGGVAE